MATEDDYIPPIVEFLEKHFHPFTRNPQDPQYTFKVFEPWRSVLRAAFTPDARGKLPYTTVILSAPKKSGKTMIGAGIALWFALCLSERNGEILMVANKREQVKGRAFADMQTAIRHSDVLEKRFRVQTNLIVAPNGTRILPITTAAGGEAGANPELIMHDELWDWGGTADEHLWTELATVLTRRNSLRLIITYAGYSATSTILWREYKQAMKCAPHPDFLALVDETGRPVVRADADAKTFCYWEHCRRLPWQLGPEADAYYLDQERKAVSPAEFLRIHRNIWSSGEEGIDLDQWDDCVDPTYKPPWALPGGYLAVGLDASFKKDLTAVMSVYKREGKYYLGPYEMWQPQPEKRAFDPEATAGQFVRELKGRFRMRDVFYDNYQFHTAALRLQRDGFRMVEWKQTEPNKKMMGNTLTELLRQRKIVLPADPRLRDQAAAVTLKLSSDGVQINKDNRNKKIDAITALSMALIAGARLPDVDTPISRQFMMLG